MVLKAVLQKAPWLLRLFRNNLKNPYNNEKDKRVLLGAPPDAISAQKSHSNFNLDFQKTQSPQLL